MDIISSPFFLRSSNGRGKAIHLSPWGQLLTVVLVAGICEGVGVRHGWIGESVESLESVAVFAKRGGMRCLSETGRVLMRAAVCGGNRP